MSSDNCCRTALIAFLFLTLRIWPVLAADNITFLKPVEGSIFHVGDTIEIEFFFNSNDTAWGVQLFDFYIDNGLIRGDMGVTAGSPYADSMRSHIAVHREFKWCIPDTLIGQGLDPFSTVNAGCIIGTRPYAFTPNQAGAFGTSGIFTVQPPISVRNPSQYSHGYQQLRMVRTTSGTSLRMCIGSASPGPALLVSPNGRIHGLFRMENGILQASLPDRAGMYLLKTDQTTRLISSF